MTKLELFDSLLEPVFVLDGEGHVQYCNEAAALLCGLNVRKILRQKGLLTELLEFQEPLEWFANLSQVSEPTPYKEVRFKNGTGTEGRVQLTAQTLTSTEENPRWIVFVRDVTLEENLQKKYRAELEKKEGVIQELQKAQAELQNYSRNLESMVQERTRELKELNVQMKALLDSLSQGFLIFNEAGDCLSAYSQACLKTLEKQPENKKIWDVLSLNSSETGSFQKWMSILFGDFLPFEDLKALGPSKYNHSEGRVIALDFFPLMSPNVDAANLRGVVLVATDITELKEAQKAAEEEKKSAQFILDIVQKQSEISNFIIEAEKLIQSIHHATHSTDIVSSRDELFRWIHTLKGGSGSFTINYISDHCHEAETLLSQMKDSPSPSLIKRFIQETNGIEQSYHHFLNEARKVLGAKAFSRDRYVPVKANDLKIWADQMALWSKGHSVSEYIYTNYIFEPLETYLLPYRDLIAKIAEKEEKKILPLVIECEGLHIPKESYSSLLNTFVHIFRNIVDHGIEMPHERVKAGKKEEGLVRFSAYKEDTSEGQRLRLSLSDDGRGIDPQAIREKLKKQNIDASNQSDAQIIQHIFDPQFSTRQEVTQLSGRGIGLEAVHFEVEALGGKIWVESKFGSGTEFCVDLPWKSINSLKKVA